MLRIDTRIDGANPGGEAVAVGVASRLPGSLLGANVVENDRDHGSLELIGAASYLEWLAHGLSSTNSTRVPARSAG